MTKAKVLGRIVVIVSIIVSVLAAIAAVLYASYQIGLMAFAAAGGGGALAILVGIVAFIVAFKVIVGITAVVLQVVGVGVAAIAKSIVG